MRFEPQNGPKKPPIRAVRTGGKALFLFQKRLCAVAQAAPEPGLSTLDRPGDGGLVHPQLFPDLPHVEALAVVEQQELPLPGRYVLPKGPDQVPLHPVELRAVVGGHTAGVDRHIRRIGPPPPITCIWHCGDTPSRNTVRSARPGPWPPATWR